MRRHHRESKVQKADREVSVTYAIFLGIANALVLITVLEAFGKLCS